MNTGKKLAAVCAAATLTILSATSAWADDLDYGLDAEIDSQDVSMTLQYDDAHGIAGPDGVTNVTLIADGDDDFNGPACNLVGNSGGVTLTLAAH